MSPSAIAAGPRATCSTLKIVGTAGLSFTSRLHLGIGIMSYLSSPLWLLMLTVGFALAVQSHLIRPEYFSHDFPIVSRPGRASTSN